MTVRRVLWCAAAGAAVPGDNPYMLARIRASGATEIADFERKVNSGIVCEHLGLSKSAL